jgi:phage baseplate assembly protein W
MATDETFYGRGVAFPVAVGVRGGIRESAGTSAIEESIRVILGTQHGERVMRPEFGCNLRHLVFEPMNEATLNVARHLVDDGLTRWEPRIEVMQVEVQAANELGVLTIQVSYRVRATQEIGTLVYPFYLGRL